MCRKRALVFITLNPRYNLIRGIKYFFLIYKYRNWKFSLTLLVFSHRFNFSYWNLIFWYCIVRCCLHTHTYTFIFIFIFTNARIFIMIEIWDIELRIYDFNSIRILCVSVMKTAILITFKSRVLRYCLNGI
jgi:hypothetical protein